MQPKAKSILWLFSILLLSRSLAAAQESSPTAAPNAGGGPSYEEARRFWSSCDRGGARIQCMRLTITRAVSGFTPEDQPPRAALASLTRVLLSSNEFIYLD